MKKSAQEWKSTNKNWEKEEEEGKEMPLMKIYKKKRNLFTYILNWIGLDRHS